MDSMWAARGIRSKEVLIVVNGPKDLAIYSNDTSRGGPRRTDPTLRRPS
jgi:hypothetical protein